MRLLDYQHNHEARARSLGIAVVWVSLLTGGCARVVAWVLLASCHSMLVAHCCTATYTEEESGVWPVKGRNSDFGYAACGLAGMQDLDTGRTLQGEHSTVSSALQELRVC